MSQTEIIDQMTELVNVLYDMEIRPNKTTALYNNAEFREFRAVVKALNMYVNMGYEEDYADRSDN